MRHGQQRGGAAQVASGDAAAPRRHECARQAPAPVSGVQGQVVQVVQAQLAIKAAPEAKLTEACRPVVGRDIHSTWQACQDNVPDHACPPGQCSSASQRQQRSGGWLAGLDSQRCAGAAGEGVQVGPAALLLQHKAQPVHAGLGINAGRWERCAQALDNQACSRLSVCLGVAPQKACGQAYTHAPSAGCRWMG